MATYPLPTLAPTLTATGLSIPSYNDVYNSLVASYQAIYGSDVYIEPDSQDGQWIAIQAKAINDSNKAALALYQAYSPTYAQGVGLDANVQLNGLQRLASTNSQAVGNVTGTAGYTITNGVVQDVNQQLWNLPATVTIPVGGSITVTVTAQNPGAIAAGVGQINKIYNPQLGWQSFTNTAVATPGAPVETDGQLRTRQKASVALPANTVIESIYAAIGQVTGVLRYWVYENSLKTTDANGAPGNCFYAVVEGGDVLTIAQAIGSKKPPGIQSYGTTTETVTDSKGMMTPISFFVLTDVPIYFAVTIKQLTGYTSTVGNDIINALVNFCSGLAIGDDVYQAQAAAVASLMASTDSETFYLVSLDLGTTASPTGTANIPIAFNQAASCTAANITLTVT